MNKIIAIALLAAVLVGGGSWVLSKGLGNDDPLLGAAVGQESAEEVDGAEIDTSSIVDMKVGEDDAPVTVVEYASFTCPHCRDFHNELYPEIKQDYIDSGEVQMIYREVYFDPYGLWASMVARCGGEMRFFGIASMIYERQQEWTQGDTPNAIAENLRTIGKTAGLSDEDLDACLTDPAMAQTLVQWYEENKEEDNVTSTPTFFINGEKFEGNWSSELVDAIDAAVGENN
ncbi:thioredoxin domain-containing protein [Pelagovum pacificum]|uniref:DsbA family protein n=1 Tax=Pelagovum pacificum TaxID=2588711 RepID=A0A5C5GGD0_9RHOB|nr:thioredoxin domain-containing protein [Pelagovum pacificum]QQA43061.1 thioredoxin domain-containing protein [Pelagovum pacificum]TNY33795.1 DsbA family protein [Pelagovum pacificum]